MEFKRILLGKPFIALLVVLLLINAWFFVYQNSFQNTGFRYYGDSYDKMLCEFQTLSHEEGHAKCVELRQASILQMVEGTWEDSVENSCMLNIIEQLEGQYSHLLGYHDYVLGVQENAKRLLSISLFSEPGSFAYKNNIKTAKDFLPLSNIEITMGHDLAVTEVFSDNWSDIIILLPVFLVCGLFLLERKEGLYTLVYATPAGRRRLAVKRVMILFFASLISVVTILGAEILMNGVVYHGLDEWNRSLQSIPMFYNVPTPVTIGEFWILYLTVKALGAFLTGLVLWLILSAVSNIPIALCFVGIIVGMEFACMAIPSSSAFAIFRYANVLSFINYIPVFTKYLNFPLLFTVISGNELVCLSLPILCIAFSLLNIFVAEKKYPVGEENKLLVYIDLIRSKLDNAFTGGGLFIKEAKKLFIYRRGFLILIILAALLTKTGVPLRDGTLYDMYLHYYEEKYSGPITEDTLTMLQDEIERADESERIAALRQLISKSEAVGEGAWILPSAPYEALFRPQRYHYTIGLVALLFLVLLAAPLLSQESQADMRQLLNATPAGRQKLWRTKQLLLFLCTLIIWLMVYGTEIFKLINAYGELSCLDAPVFSLMEFAVVEWNMTIGQVLILLYGLRLIVLLGVAEICFCLSGLCKRNSNAVLLGCSIIVLPASLAAIGSDIGKNISVLLPLTVVDIIPTLLPYLMIVSLYFAALIISGLRVNK